MRVSSAKLTEAAFQKMVVDLAILLGWKVASFRAVRVQRANGQTYYETPVGAQGRGWPDLFLVKPLRAIALELKVGKNKPTPEQREWMHALEGGGIHAYVVRPEDWTAIEKLLRG